MNTLLPHVSIILTVYKRTTYLHHALQGIDKQTYKDFEVIVADDSASDDIRTICDTFPELHIRYMANPKTLGVTLNIRSALENSNGKYIAILNDDDCWEPQFLEKLVEVLDEKQDRVLAFSDHWIMDETGTIDIPATEYNTLTYGRHVLPEGEVKDLATLVLEKNGVPLAMASLFRKDALDPANLMPEVIGAYDFWVSCLLAASGKPFYYLPQRLTYYRLHPEMETARKAHDKNENRVYIYGKLLDWNMFPSKRKFLMEQFSESLKQVGRDYLVFGYTQLSRAYFLRSFKVVPNAKAAAGFFLSFMPEGARKMSRIYKNR